MSTVLMREAAVNDAPRQVAFTSPKLTHLKRIVDPKIGIWQHCVLSDPDRRHGFSIDDQARALIVGLGMIRRNFDVAYARNLVSVTFDYLDNAQLPSGRFHNWCDADGAWVDQDGSDDCLGRAVWALGVAFEADQPQAKRDRARRIMERALPSVARLTYARSIAYCILGLSRLGDEHKDLIETLAARLMDLLWRHSTGNWYWFEEAMTYCNARIPQGLLAASEICPDRTEFRKAGLKSLEFLLQAMKRACGAKCYAPIGNEGWYRKTDAAPAVYSQQPVDAGATAEACLHAERLSGQMKYRTAAIDVMAWYDGHNVAQQPLVDRETGGVYDGIMYAGINRNMGAESVISYLMAYLAFRDAEGFASR